MNNAEAEARIMSLLTVKVPICRRARSDRARDNSQERRIEVPLPDSMPVATIASSVFKVAVDVRPARELVEFGPDLEVAGALMSSFDDRPLIVSLSIVAAADRVVVPA